MTSKKILAVLSVTLLLALPGTSSAQRKLAFNAAGSRTAAKTNKKRAAKPAPKMKPKKTKVARVRTSRQRAASPKALPKTASRKKLAAAAGKAAATKSSTVKKTPKGGDALNLDVDESELVMAAAKRVQTRAEVPSIVYVLSKKSIEQQGHRSLSEAIGRAVPGNMPFGWQYQMGPMVLTKGLVTSTLHLYDGVSLRDSATSYQILQSKPLEMIRRVEVTTSPGGVLWGASSFLGVVSLTTRTADDLNGVEAGVGLGHGPGRPDSYRAYVMAGQKFFKDKLKVLLHVSFDTWRAAEREMRSNVIMPPLPVPRGPALFSPLIKTVPVRSTLLTFNGNMQYGPFSVGWHLPFGNLTHAMSFHAGINNQEMGERSIGGCTAPGFSCIDPEDRRGMVLNYYDRLVYAGYRDNFFGGKLQISIKSSFVQTVRDLKRYAGIPPSSLLPGGFNYSFDYTSWRVSTTLDASIAFSDKHRLLLGGDISYDRFPERFTNFLTYDSTIDLLPIICPPDKDGNRCPLRHARGSDRLLGAFFVDDQISFGNLTLDAGVRIEVAGGKRGYSPVALLSGGAVYRFYKRWHAKVNYAEGFRPPPFLATDGTGEAISWSPNPNLSVERSRSIVGQVITDVLRNVGPIKSLQLQANYSYAWISNFIIVENGLYSNSDDIGINAVEFSSKFNLKGGHSLSFAYTYLRLEDAGRGVVRSLPGQWFSATLFVRLWKDYLNFSTNLLVMGSFEDPNKHISSDSAPLHLGNVATDASGQIVPVLEPIGLSRGSDNLLDRMPAAAVWNIGIRSYLLNKRLLLSADVYNVTNQKYAYPEAAYDRTVRLQFLPNIAPGFSFFFTARYRI